MTPLLVRGAILEAPALQKWNTLDYLLQQVGNETPCHVETGGGAYNNNSNNNDNNNNDSSPLLHLPFEAYVDYLKLALQQHDVIDKEDLLYLAQNDLPPSLYHDLAEFVTEWIPPTQRYSVMWWMGPQQTFSPLHNDPLHNWFAQIVGRKQITLVAPDTPREYLYTQGNTSQVDMEHTEQYPLFQQHVQRTTVTLQPGDVLYIPARQFHHARALEFSISVNVWWRK